MPSSPPTEGFLIPEEVAERLRTSTRVIVLACRSGHLRATKPNQTWLITEDDLNDYIARNYNDLERAAS